MSTIAMPMGPLDSLRPPQLPRTAPPPALPHENVNGLERRVARCARIVIGAAAEQGMRPAHPAYVDWLMEQSAAAIEHVHTRQPSWQTQVDVEGPVNLYKHHFDVPLGSRYISDDMHELVRSGALTELQTAKQHDAHHPDEPRLAYLTPAGLVIDEVRVEREDLADLPLCAWMLPKAAADTIVGVELARRLGVPFVGVRILLLGAIRRSVLAVANECGVLVSRPLPDLNAAPAAVGLGNVKALPNPRMTSPAAAASVTDEMAAVAVSR